MLLMGLFTAGAQEDTPPPQIDTALNELSERVGEDIQVDDLTEYTWQAQTFSDASLGCESSEGFFAQVIIEGYQFTLVYEGMQYDYRVSEDDELALLCGEPTEAEATSPTDELDAPLVAMFPLSGKAGATVQVIANGLPAERMLEIGMGLADSESVVVDEAETTTDGAIYIEVSIPEEAQVGSRWVVVLSLPEERDEYRSLVYQVTE